MASISFNDGSAASLDNAKPAPGNRFDRWEPSTREIGESAIALGTGARSVFVFRTDRRVRFTLSKIPNASMAVMLRLGRHLDRGGTVTVNTDDKAARSYTCMLAPGAEPPRPMLTDPQLLEYSLEFDLLSTGVADLICLY
jgi:hypothetical protein